MRQVLTLSLLAAFGLAAPAAVQDYDIVIANGRVIDPESGLDAVRTLGVRGNTIAAIGDASLRGATLIDARGLVVAPGFIDLHRHGQDDENYAHAARDGVTSVFELEVGTPDVERWYREREPGRLINYGVAIGHIGARIAVMGDSGDFLPSGPAGSAVATEAQVAEMARRIDEGLRQGAVAVGFGTAYTPAASPWEVLEMFRVAGRHRAPAHIHVRRGVEGVQEALADAVATGTPLHIVHVNSTAGNDVGRMLALITDAQQRGIDVTTEAYPYNRGSTRLESALYDNWERMTDAEIGEITWVATGESLTRESLARYRKVGGSVIQRPGRMENVQQAINSPITMIASDGSQLRNGRGHPRATGTFSQVLGRYVREAGTLTLMDALRKMTIMPARRLEARVPAMRNKGRLRVGADADLVVFDAQRVIDRSTYQQAGLAPDGIAHVIVNGTPVVSGGRVVDGVAPGRAIRAPVGAAAGASAPSAQAPAFDVLIRGGQVLDGTGAAAVRADVGIRGDRITAVGQLDSQTARRTIDATGLVVAPGFIDLHTHSEMPLLADGTAQSEIWQGVTLDITGESSSPAPRDGLPAEGRDGPASIDV